MKSELAATRRAWVEVLQWCSGVPILLRIGRIADRTGNPVLVAKRGAQLVGITVGIFCFSAAASSTDT
jgi:hypothetical protein